jgi:hypothetical protein
MSFNTYFFGRCTMHGKSEIENPKSERNPPPTPPGRGARKRNPPPTPPLASPAGGLLR